MRTLLFGGALVGAGLVAQAGTEWQLELSRQDGDPSSSEVYFQSRQSGAPLQDFAYGPGVLSVVGPDGGSAETELSTSVLLSESRSIVDAEAYADIDAYVTVSMDTTIAWSVSTDRPEALAVVDVQRFNTATSRYERLFRSRVVGPGGSDSGTFELLAGTSYLLITEAEVDGSSSNAVAAITIATPAGCNVADIAPTLGVLDIDDVDAFISAFLAGCP